MDFSGIPWPAVTAGSGGWLIAFFFCISIIRGKLVPRSAVDDVIHDRDEWRASHRISEAAREVSAKQVTALLEQGQTTEAFIKSLPQPGRPSP